MKPVLFDFGTLDLLGLNLSLRVYGYGLMLVFGFLLGIQLARYRARRFGENPDVMTYCGILSLIGGILGARIAYVIEKWNTQFSQASNPLAAMLDVTSGGLIYYGGVVLATLMTLAYLFLKKQPMRRYLDIVAPSLMIGLAFGRAGCLLNGCCYGARCDERWAMGVKFPMYTPPLLNFGSGAGPFSAATEGPSPVYGHQLEANLVYPDERLIRHYPSWLLGEGSRSRAIRLPRDLHGQLQNDQMDVMLEPREEAQKKFQELAARGDRLGQAEWKRGLTGGGFLRGSESWEEASRFDRNRNGTLDFDEAWSYLQERLRRLRAHFGLRAEEPVTPERRSEMDQYLREDLYRLAEAQWSRSVKPAQALALINALVLAGLLLLFSRIRRREGQVFVLLLVLYPITRFVEELIRDDNAHDLLGGILTHNQYTSMAIFITGILLWVALGKLPASAGATWLQRYPKDGPVRTAHRSR